MASAASGPGRGGSTTSTYIDLDALTADDFSPFDHANNLVLATNNPSDPAIDLTTPLSRVLFDLQEIDSHVHTLTSRSALDILKYTSTQNAAAQRILAKVEEDRARLNASYERLEKEVLVRHQKAVEAKTTALRSWEVLRLARSVQRILNLARQFEVVVAESGLGGTRVGKEDHGALARASLSILAFRDIMASEGGELGRINIIKTLRGRVFEDGEARILDYARRVIREFSMSTLSSTASSGGNPATSAPTYREAEDSRARFTSASHILYLLSPAPRIDGQKMTRKDFEPEYLIRALQGYLQTAITSSSASIGRALGQLPSLDRALLETSARCQNIVALQALLRTISAPEHPLLEPEALARAEALDIDTDSDSDSDPDEVIGPDKSVGTDNFLTLLLHALDTASLPSYFWRSLASSLSTRVQEILNRGGVSARTLRSQRDAVRAEIRECVLRGSRMPRTVGLGDARGSAAIKGEEVIENWEREAAVMVGSVVGLLGR
ncbi:Conserved oligomeric Golgi complex subunit [Cladophialophora chaetospira]|uniref:Conserved oligomeric Golgi complex subunit 5 n=1 Tax=Cladophialophora chaetospira TaxID=386627 RepID=A0AA38WZM4_9EURO|nr:Conserved oligomeric Golgi complex subunit [Cladophialophora chaetospira]